MKRMSSSVTRSELQDTHRPSQLIVAQRLMFYPTKSQKTLDGTLYLQQNWGTLVFLFLLLCYVYFCILRPRPPSDAEQVDFFCFRLKF